MDIFGSIVCLAITLVLAVLVGPFIFMADPGPILFKQKRVGRNELMSNNTGLRFAAISDVFIGFYGYLIDYSEVD